MYNINMKIIEKHKLIGSPNKNSDSKTLRILIYKNIKKKSAGEKVILVMKSEILNPRTPEDYDSQINTINEYAEFYRVSNIIISQKEKSMEIERFEFKNGATIKNLAYVSADITEINASDPRFAILWYYNQNIVINLYFNNEPFFVGNFYDFSEKFGEPKIGNQEFWKHFLWPYATVSGGKVKGFGKAKFMDYLKKVISYDYDGINNILKKYNIDFLKDEQRKSDLDKLMSEMI